MSNPLERWHEYKLSEAYEVVRTVEVVMDDETYRIDVLKSYWNSKIGFTTRAQIAKDVLLTPEYPEGAKPEKMGVLVDYDLPWTARDDADSALAQALGFLAEQAKRK